MTPDLQWFESRPLSVQVILWNVIHQRRSKKFFLEGPKTGHDEIEAWGKGMSRGVYRDGCPPPQPTRRSREASYDEQV